MDEHREEQAELEQAARDAEDGTEWDAFFADLNVWRPVSEHGLRMADHD